MTSLSVTLPWPPVELSPNFRTRSTRWIAVKRKEYRASCAEAAWTRGVQPGRDLKLEKIVFHPPNRQSRDLDNLVARFKGGQDGLAEAMGVDDEQFNGVPRDIGEVVKGGAVVALLAEIPG
jgi:crossover junction endodeoxyribonuclease RusA